MASPLLPPNTERRMLRWRVLYARLLCIELVIFGVQWIIRAFLSSHQDPPAHVALADLAWFWLVVFFLQHRYLLILIPPAAAGASIAGEKESGTLTLLLTTPATSWDIVLGRWLAHAWAVLVLALPVLPILGLLLAVLDLSLILLVRFLVESCLLVGLTTALALTVSCFARRGDVAQVVAVVVAGALSFEPPVLLPLGGAELELNRTEVLGVLGGLDPARCTVWAAAILALLVLTARQLRPAYARFLEKQDKPRVEFVRRRRPPVSDQPLRWKERWTVASTWIRWLTAPQVALAVCVLGGGVGWFLEPGTGPNLAHAAAFLLLPAWFLQGKNAGTICREREKATWDLLRITALTPRQIVRGKLWGYLDGFKRPMVAYLAGFLLGCLGAGNWRGLVWFPIFWFLAWGMIYYMGANGIHWSARCATAREASLRAIANFFADWFGNLPAAVLAAVLVGTCGNFLGQLGLAEWWYGLVLLAFLFPMVLLSFSNAEKLLLETEKAIAEEGRDRLPVVLVESRSESKGSERSWWYRLGRVFAGKR